MLSINLPIGLTRFSMVLGMTKKRCWEDLVRIGMLKPDEYVAPFLSERIVRAALNHYGLDAELLYDFPLVDLDSQCWAVTTILDGMLVEEQLRWLGCRGVLKRDRVYADIYDFESVLGRRCRVVADVFNHRLLVNPLSVLSRVARFSSYNDPRCDSDRKVAQSVVSELSMAINLLALHIGRYPDMEEGLNALIKAPPHTSKKWCGPYIPTELPSDPWTNSYVYRIPSIRPERKAFDVFSLGPDGIESDDDIEV